MRGRKLRKPEQVRALKQEKRVDLVAIASLFVAVLGVIAAITVPEVRDWFALDPSVTAPAAASSTAEIESLNRQLREDNRQLRASHDQLSRKFDVLHGDMQELIAELRKDAAIPQQQLEVELSALKTEVDRTEATQSPSRDSEFSNSQARLLMLSARKSDIDLTIQNVLQTRMGLANVQSQLFAAAAKQEPSSELQEKIRNIQQVDKALEMQLLRLESQSQEAQTEIDAIRRVIARNIESTFKTFG